MRLRPRISLAWCNLTHDPVRLALFAAGVSFAVTLMFVQNGFRHALLDSNLLLIERLNADLVILNRRQSTIAAPESFSRRRLKQAEAVAGVQRVVPLRMEYRLSSLRHAAADPSQRDQSRTIRVVGIEPGSDPLNLPEVQAAASDLRVPGRVLFDRTSKDVYGPIAVGGVTELAGQRVEVVGSFELGTDFGAEGTLVVSEQTFIDLLRQSYALEPDEQVEVGLVRLERSADPAAVQAALQDLFSQRDIKVLTLTEMMQQERDFWLDFTPIGYVFGLGVAIGFVVGMVICYQILSSEVADHLPEYATLKAIGYSNRYLSGVVLQESLLLAVFGFLPGLAVSSLLFVYLAGVTGLPMRLTVPRILMVFVLTVVMCAGSGLIALRKAQEVDPAEVF
jgi:putative ABC transport system permease protein